MNYEYGLENYEDCEVEANKPLIIDTNEKSFIYTKKELWRHEKANTLIFTQVFVNKRICLLNQAAKAHKLCKQVIINYITQPITLRGKC
jgi:hypothetical protein